MTDIHAFLSTLRRPRLLIRAARFGLDEYNRKRDLKRLIGATTTPSPHSAVNALIEKEAHLEQVRKDGDATYSVARHVEVLIALMAETRLLPQLKDVA